MASENADEREPFVEMIDAYIVDSIERAILEQQLTFDAKDHLIDLLHQC